MTIRRKLLWLAPLALLAGVGCGLLHARWSRGGEAELDAWPARGRGATLVEYLDPSCPASRSFHQRLQHLLRSRPGIKHVLVPVAMSRTRSGPTPADLLCAMTTAEAFETADRWASQGPDLSVGQRLSSAQLRSCAIRVERATRRTGSLHPSRAPSVPMVEFGQRVYSGLGSWSALELALEGSS